MPPGTDLKAVTGGSRRVRGGRETV